MVQVAPPEGWVTPPTSVQGGSEAIVTAEAVEEPPARRVGTAHQERDPSTARQKAADPAGPAPRGPGRAPATGPTVPPVARRPAAGDASPPATPGKRPAAAGLIPPISVVTVGESLPLPPPIVNPPVALASPAAVTLGTAASVKFAWLHTLWAKWLLLASAPLVGLGIVVGTWAIFFNTEPQPPTDAASAGQQSDQVPLTATPRPKTKSVVPSRLTRRWLPNATMLVCSLRASHFAAERQASDILKQIDPLWRQSAGAVLKGTGLSLEHIERMTWVTTDLSRWRDRSLVIIELDETHNTRALATAGEAVDAGMAAVPCRRLPGDAWPFPVAVIDDQTIVTGHEDLLRGLASRTEPHLESAAVDRLLGAMAPDADVTLLVDLEAAREAKWGLPAAVFDVWPAGKRAWQTLWDKPTRGLGCTLHWSQPQPLRSEVALACEGESAAEQVRAALDELIEKTRSGLPARIQSLVAAVQAGRLPESMAATYRFLMESILAVLQASHSEVAEGTVWLRLTWTHSPLLPLVAGIHSSSAIQADWLAAALEGDKTNSGRLATGLTAYAKENQGQLPSAAMGGDVLPPETRLSWIASMLPYYGHAEWQRELEQGYIWNDGKNAAVARRNLPEVVNPAIGPQTNAAGFPVTHYVGVAGLGEDAARLKADEPRAGVFGYRRVT
jgi:hypothetical protein